MVITAIEVYQAPIKLKKPFVISLGPLTHAGNIYVVISTNIGLTGFGECSPFMTINGESMETGFVVAQYLAKKLIGMNPLEIEKCTVAMDSVIFGNSSIKSAFDMALYDIAAQNSGVPLYRFLGGKNNKTIQTDYTVSLGDKKTMAEDAVQIKNRGFQFIKVKVGESKEKDIERIRLIRESIGPEIPLRLDANQGWNTNDAVEILNAVADCNIQLCEEPIPRWNFMELPEIREKSPIPIMADESCCDHHDAQRLIDLEACELFNIKLGKSAGIFTAIKIIELAEMAGINIQIGGFLESRLGFTASAHLALTSKNIVYFDFDTPLMLIDDPVIGGIQYLENGKIQIPETPGLGASIEPDFLKTLKKVAIKN
ncbi:MAG TPA: dipeptide epimerase [Prolixibacteraceae bacterium]|nr:dipeptide epimerase [Prolixibacteraceae bacterium]